MLRENIIKEIEEALPWHISYEGHPQSEKYLKTVDRLSFYYKGAPGIRVSKLMEDYYKSVGVANLDEAIKRLKELKGEKK